MAQTMRLEDLINTVIAENASDLHLSAGHPPMMRVSDSLIPIAKYEELTEEDTKSLATELLDQEGMNRFLRTKEHDFAYSYKEEARFRCNCYFQQGKIGIAMRLIPKVIRTLEELNLPPSLEMFTQLKQGFFLVVGPVGQGKSTTLASMVELINSSRAEHIITIEDPVEYTFEPKKSIIDQREVRYDTRDFHTALSAMFRQDVDVVLVGEMRNRETIATAVTAGETGHLVFSTLHTNNAAQTIHRIIDSFPAAQQEQIRLQLSASLSGIFSQRLIPRVQGGVVPAYELLINNNAIANLVREGRVHEIDSVIQTSSEQGMISINQSLANLVRVGEITLENARKYSPNIRMLESLL